MPPNPLVLCPRVFLYKWPLIYQQPFPRTQRWRNILDPPMSVKAIHPSWVSKLTLCRNINGSRIHCTRGWMVQPLIMNKIPKLLRKIYIYIFCKKKQTLCCDICHTLKHFLKKASIFKLSWTEREKKNIKLQCHEEGIKRFTFEVYHYNRSTLIQTQQ